MNVSKSSSATTGLLLIGASVLLSSIAQLLLKLAMTHFPGTDVFNLDMSWLFLLALTAGLSCYALSMLVWMMALTRHELSFAYPLLSLSYIFVYILAVLLPPFHESVSLMKTVGILCIFIGVVLVTRSNNTREGMI